MQPPGKAGSETRDSPTPARRGTGRRVPAPRHQAASRGVNAGTAAPRLPRDVGASLPRSSLHAAAPVALSPRVPDAPQASDPCNARGFWYPGYPGCRCPGPCVTDLKVLAAPRDASAAGPQAVGACRSPECRCRGSPPRPGMPLPSSPPAPGAGAGAAVPALAEPAASRWRARPRAAAHLPRRRPRRSERARRGARALRGRRRRRELRGAGGPARRPSRCRPPPARWRRGAGAGGESAVPDSRSPVPSSRPPVPGSWLPLPPASPCRALYRGQG